MKVEVYQGDITEAEVEAIVNAANTHLWMGSGVAGAIKRKGGQIVEDEAVELGPISVIVSRRVKLLETNAPPSLITGVVFAALMVMVTLPRLRTSSCPIK